MLEYYTKPITLTFAPGNWNAPQTVTVTGQEDFIDDRDATYDVTVAVDTNPFFSTDTTGYLCLGSEIISVTNNDNDTTGVSVTPLSGNTTDDGGTFDFDVVLDSEPTAHVSIGVSTRNALEGLISDINNLIPTDIFELTFSPLD